MKAKAVFILLLLFVLLLVGCKAKKTPSSMPQSKAPAVKTAQVKKQNFDVTLRVSGVLESEKSEPIYNQIQQTQISWLLPDGTTIKPGDVVMKFDPSTPEKSINDLNNQISDFDKKSLSDITNVEKRLQNAQTALDKAKDDLKLNQLQSKTSVERANAEAEFMQKEVELAQGQLDKRKRLAAERLIPINQVDEAEDELREKQFGLEKAQRQLERAKQDAELNDGIKALDIQKAELEVKSAKSALDQTLSDTARSKASLAVKLDDAQQILADCELKSTTSGMMLLEKTWDNSLRSLRVGDRIWEGQKVASIVNPSQMQVRCDINEADIEQIKSKQKAIIQVPAIDNRVLKGIVKNIDNLAREKQWWEGGTPGKQVFSATITISDKDKRLRPGMGATVEIVLEKANQMLTVPLDAIFKKQNKYVVYKVQDNHYSELPVEVLKRNEMLAAIKGNLKTSDIVACEKPPVNSNSTTAEIRQ